MIEINLKEYQSILKQIHRFDFSTAGPAARAARLAVLREAARQGKSAAAERNSRLKRLLPEAFALTCAVVREAFGWTVFDSQLLAAIAMNSGRVIELDTGEGKTLAAVFVAGLRALAGKKVHVLTFNDYLAERDAAWMAPIYERLGLRVAAIRQGMSPAQRREAYQADVTYMTAKEAGFDYLRGFLADSPADWVQPPFEFAIVDEADSILIDEARIPLVIAGGEDAPGSIDPALVLLVAQLKAGRHFELDEYADHVMLTEAGIVWLEQHLHIANLYDAVNIVQLAQIQLLLQANNLLKRDVDYIVRDDTIQLVDEFTGRVIRDRQWPEGLHEAVEIKEGLKGRSRGRILNRITLHDFLRLYPGLCGMTGTARSAANELYEFYGLHVTRIPPHVPCRRLDYPDMIFNSRAEKELAIVLEIERRHAMGQPVLVGTASVEESERLAEVVHRRGLTCAVLNARQDAAEATIVARAGEQGAITISTNMAGRGVDIRLADSVNGLCVIGANRHRSERIDNQLRGRAGRQGDVGESIFMISLDDDLIDRYNVRSVLPPPYDQVPTADLDAAAVPRPIADPEVARLVDHTQRVVEGQLYQQRMSLERYTMLVEDQRRLIHKLRQDMLSGQKRLSIWQELAGEAVEKLTRQTSADEVARAQQQAGALLISRGWADFLELVEELTDHISLMKSGAIDPLTTFNKQLIEAFAHFLDCFETDMAALTDRLIVRDGKILFAESGLKSPPSTRTYLIDDGSDTLDQALGVSNLIAAAVNPALSILTLLARRATTPPDKLN